MHYSLFSLVGNALTGHRRWQRAWRDPAPKSEYDVVIVGAGGHGLATAYYLAKNHGVTDIAVLEKGWVGGRNAGRNTTVVRSNYLWDDSAHLYEHPLKLWEGLSQDLNFNVMFSQRGVVFLAQTRHELREMNRRVGALRLNGIDSEMLTVAQLKREVPILDTDPGVRYPILGGMIQRRGGTARHDAVAWGFAPAAGARGARRALSDRQPAAHAAAMGRDRRLRARRQPDHRPDAGRRAVRQLRLGHWRLQGDTGLGLGLRRHHRERPAAQAQRSLLARPLQRRSPHR